MRSKKVLNYINIWINKKKEIMAKKQTFNDKTSKQDSVKSKIKLIRSSVSENGALRFSEDMLEVSDGKTPDAVIKEFIASK